MSEEERRLLEKQLWSIANILRGKMHADEYKNYILGFIFYKYLSERLESYIDHSLLQKEKFTFSEVAENTKEGKEIIEAVKAACVGHLGFFLKPTELFAYLVKKGKGEIKGQDSFILENLKNVLNTIEKTSRGTKSEADFQGLFDDVDLTSSKLGSSEQKKNEVIVDVLGELSKIDFKLNDSKSDLLGDAYEYLIGEFASGAGKKGGEFYTPAQVSRLMARIVSMDKKRLKSVYDPTCGSGSLLLRLREYVKVEDYFGQELNPTTYNLARMNMILHGVHFENFKIEQGDTLEEDKHLGLEAEAIIANPPFSAKWKSDNNPEHIHDERFSKYGRLAPKRAADFAFITHMLHHLAPNGTMAIVLPHGALFRSGAEGHIRKYIIEKQNYLDAVIGLPLNLFFGTDIPAAILIFKKCRQDDEDILFIDASNEFVKSKNQNKLDENSIQKIFDIYKNRSEVRGFSHKADINEISKNDFNLNISRYVDTFEIEEQIDIQNVIFKLNEFRILEMKIYSELKKFYCELNLPLPEGNNIFLLNKYRKGLMQKIFHQEIRFKSESSEEFPDWEDKILSDIFKEIKNTVGNRVIDTYSITAGIGFVSQKEKFGKDISGKQNSKYTVLGVNQFTYNKGNSKTYKYGCIYLNEMNIDIAVPNVFISFELRDLDIIPQFFAKLFESHYLDKSLRGIISSSARMNGLLNVSKKSFFKLPIKFPSRNEQKKIANFLYTFDAWLNTKQIQALENIKWPNNF